MEVVLPEVLPRPITAAYCHMSRHMIFQKRQNPRLARVSEVLRGPERIRTAVGAFAELSLATRPQDHFRK